MTLTGTRFTNNTAAQGGGVYLTGNSGSLSRLTNVILDRNTATSAQGNALFTEMGNVSLLHGTIASPTLGSGSAVYGATANDWFINTLVASYTVGYEQAENTPGWLYEYRTLFTGVITPYLGSNVNVDSTSFSGTAGFVDSLGGDYHLTADSQAINRGLELMNPVTTSTMLDGCISGTVSTDVQTTWPAEVRCRHSVEALPQVYENRLAREARS